jgi:hypothetical protein
MNKKLINFGMASIMAVSAIVPSSAAFAHGRHNYNNYYDARYDNDGYDRDYREVRYDRGYNSDRSYNYNRGYNDNRGYRCKKGTTGLIVGAVAGGLLGRAVVGRYGDRTAGTIIGAGAGALAGRAVERSDNRC